MSDKPHNDTRYRAGCRCGVCVEDHRRKAADYNRRRSAAKLAPVNMDDTGVLGPLEAATLAELQEIGAESGLWGIVALEQARLVDRARAAAVWGLVLVGNKNLMWAMDRVHRGGVVPKPQPGNWRDWPLR